MRVWESTVCDRPPLLNGLELPAVEQVWSRPVNDNNQGEKNIMGYIALFRVFMRVSVGVY